MSKSNSRIDGSVGEQIINNFVDRDLTSILSFPNPKTKNNAQVADNLIWNNRDAILIEVKTRTEGTTSIENWARSRIQEGIKQITTNYKRIQNNEVINLHNKYFNVQLDCSNLSFVIGLIILVHNDNLSILPSEIDSEIYNMDIPIQVFSINDLNNLSNEIDTFQDLLWYLGDRYNYIKSWDIHTNCELEPLGYYFSNEYNFPKQKVNFTKSAFWRDYQKNFHDKIKARNEENVASEWIDTLENAFTKHRKLHDGFPIGLYFAWELGSLPRRVRSLYGQKMETVQDWFDNNKLERKFAFQNGKTGNWLVFLYYRGDDKQIEKRLNDLVRLKQIVEVEKNNFQFAIYGLGIRVSVLDPPKLMGLAYSTFFCDEKIINRKYLEADLKEARKIWGQRKKIKIREFPEI